MVNVIQQRITFWFCDAISVTKAFEILQKAFKDAFFIQNKSI